MQLDDISPEPDISELRTVTCHGITQCYLSPDTSKRAPPNPSQTGWYSIKLPRRDERLSLQRWLGTYRLRRRFTCQQTATHPSSNRAQCRATTLIETNVLPLLHAAAKAHIKIQKGTPIHLNTFLQHQDSCCDLSHYSYCHLIFFHLVIAMTSFYFCTECCVIFCQVVAL